MEGKRKENMTGFRGRSQTVLTGSIDFGIVAVSLENFLEQSLFFTKWGSFLVLDQGLFVAPWELGHCS